MLSIKPLEPGKGVFVAEDDDDLIRFYGLGDSSDAKKNDDNSSLNSALCTLPMEISTRSTMKIAELEVSSQNGVLKIMEIPPLCKEIILYESTDLAKPLEPGQICILSPNGGFPKAFYRPMEQNEMIM